MVSVNDWRAQSNGFVPQRNNILQALAVAW
jgi:hypothetical protein